MAFIWNVNSSLYKTALLACVTELQEGEKQKYKVTLAKKLV